MTHYFASVFWIESRDSPVGSLGQTTDPQGHTTPSTHHCMLWKDRDTLNSSLGFHYQKENQPSLELLRSANISWWPFIHSFIKHLRGKEGNTDFRQDTFQHAYGQHAYLPALCLALHSTWVLQGFTAQYQTRNVPAMRNQSTSSPPHIKRQNFYDKNSEICWVKATIHILSQTSWDHFISKVTFCVKDDLKRDLSLIEPHPQAMAFL